MSLEMVKLAEPDLEVSAWLVAVTCTVAGDGRSMGAVKSPALVIVPTAAFPPETPLTFQLTAVLFVLVTFAVNVAVFPSNTKLLLAVTVTAMGGGGGGGGGALDTEPPPQPNAEDSASRRAPKTK